MVLKKNKKKNENMDKKRTLPGRVAAAALLRRRPWLRCACLVAPFQAALARVRRR